MPQAPSGQIITGAQWGAFPGAPPADLSTLGLQLAHILPPVSAYFSADASVKVSNSPLVFYDRVRQGVKWSGEGSGPTDGALIGTMPAVTCVNVGSKSLRADTNSTLNGAFSLIGAFDVSSALLALSTIFRVLLCKGSVANANRFQLSIEPTDNHWVLTIPSVTGAFQNLTMTFAPGTGAHVFCLSVANDKTIKFYDNKSGTPQYSGTLTNVVGPMTDRWSVGGVPSTGPDWDGKIGHMFMLEADPLHGTTAYDAARVAAMSLLGTAAAATIDLT